MLIREMHNRIMEIIGRVPAARELGLISERIDLWINHSIDEYVNAAISYKDNDAIAIDGLSRINTLMVAETVAGLTDLPVEILPFPHLNTRKASIKLRNEYEEQTYESGLIGEGKYTATNSMAVVRYNTFAASSGITQGQTYKITNIPTQPGTLASIGGPSVPTENAIFVATLTQTSAQLAAIQGNEDIVYYNITSIPGLQAGKTYVVKTAATDNTGAQPALIGSSGLVGDVFVATKTLSLFALQNAVPGIELDYCYFDQQIITVPNTTTSNYTIEIITGAVQKSQVGLSSNTCIHVVSANTSGKEICNGKQKDVSNPINLLKLHRFPAAFYDPFINTFGDSVPGLVWGNYLTVFSVRNTIDSINVIYIRRPAKVKIDTVQDPSFCHCDLPINSQNSIVEMAAQFILKNTSNNNKQQ